MKRWVRPMKDACLDQVLAIEQASFQDPWPSFAFTAELEHSWSWFWVIGPGGAAGRSQRIEGYIICWVIAGEMHLMNLAVDPHKRRLGLAATLLDCALARFARSGGGMVSLEVRPSNHAARRLYESFGFEVVGRRQRYYRLDDEDALIMALQVETWKRKGLGGARRR